MLNGVASGHLARLRGVTSRSHSPGDMPLLLGRAGFSYSLSVILHLREGTRAELSCRAAQSPMNLR